MNIGNPTTNQTDVPRFSETRGWVENFNIVGGSEQETVYQNTFQPNHSYSTPAASGTGTLIQTSMTNHPHGNVSKTYVGDSGWKESLPIVTEDWTDENSTLTRKRWSWTNWTQDDTSLSYIKNPRTTESKVGDDENNFIRRSTTDYRLLLNTTIAEYGLVDKVKIYDADQTTVLKQVETDYNLNIVYVDKRIIGLPSETRSYGMENSSLTLISKSTYNYDEGDFSDSSLEQNITPIQHDSAYDSTFIIGRGNVTSTTRHDVTGQTSSVISNVKYNTAGSIAARILPDPNNSNGRLFKTSYLDNFNDSPSNKNTYAYPTKIYDAANNYSEVKYRYDIGANVEAISPSPNPSNNGLNTKREYDSLGRINKQILLNNGAYIKYDYTDNSQLTFTTKSAFVDNNQDNLVDSSDEVILEVLKDGYGRTLKSRIEQPNSSGGYAGSISEYDILGQKVRSTVRTEVDSNWNPSGDDDRGIDATGNSVWLWISQEYDWKGRVTKRINTDGTNSLISYDGCGWRSGNYPR